MYNKLKVVKLLYKNKIIKINMVLLIIPLILLFSCKGIKKEDNNTNLRINDIELLNTDYEIISNLENKKENYDGVFYIKYEIIIKNPEIIIKINDLINPVIYLNINNKKYLAKGLWILSSAIPQNCDYFFNLDINYKISLYNNIIKLYEYNN